MVNRSGKIVGEPLRKAVAIIIRESRFDLLTKAF
jgi:hypothetical protein